MVPKFVIEWGSIRFEVVELAPYYYCEGVRTEERIAELLVLLLRHHVPKEEIHPRRRGEETKVSWELQVGRIG